MEPHFSITPEEGYITSGMEVSFEVTYHPTEVGKESLYKNMPCLIQGGNPLCLTLSGVCVGPPAVKEVGASQGWTSGGSEPHKGTQSSAPVRTLHICSLPTTGTLIQPCPLLGYSFLPFHLVNSCSSLSLDSRLTFSRKHALMPLLDQIPL